MSSSAPRRLAVLRSHLRPDGPALLAEERDSRSAAPAAGAISTLTCASGGGGGAAAGGDGDGDGCVFCQIIRGDAPAYKVYEDDVCLCILDSHPLAPGHSLIIPKCHFPSLEATPPAVVAAICSKVPFLSNAIMKATECDSFNLVVNNGAAAGQVIFHSTKSNSDTKWCNSFAYKVGGIFCNLCHAWLLLLQTHFHIIPRRSGDKLWPTESFRRRSIAPNETSGLVTCIKEQLHSSPEGCKTGAPSVRKEP